MTGPEYSDELFFSELEEGHTFAEYVTDRLHDHGVAARLSPLEKRKSWEDRHRFGNERDITVDCKLGGFVVIEVKSSAYLFTGPTDVPFPAMNVDTPDGWAKKDPIPVAVVLISQPTQGMAVVPVSTRPDWTTRTTFDRVRAVPLTTWQCPKALLRPFDEFVGWLRERVVCVDPQLLEEAFSRPFFSPEADAGVVQQGLFVCSVCGAAADLWRGSEFRCIAHRAGL